MELKEKEFYASPTMQIVELKAEGTICLGSMGEGLGNGFSGGWEEDIILP
jgi:hypothetical protein